jgi:hypothetical protein
MRCGLALNEDFFLLEHLWQFIDLCVNLRVVYLDESMEDDITWKFSVNAEYLPYNVQILGATLTNMNRMVWKILAPYKIKSFACLAIQNQFCTLTS